jgi:hypothetical protein
MSFSQAQLVPSTKFSGFCHLSRNSRIVVAQCLAHHDLHVTTKLRVNSTPFEEGFMSLGWNFERRRDTCAQFLIGVSCLVCGFAERETNLEAVRNRMRLSPEEALFAARRLNDEKLIVFVPGGSVRSLALGIERAVTISNATKTKIQNGNTVTQLLLAGGTPLAVVAAVIRVEGALACGAPDDDGKTETDTCSYRLVLVSEEVRRERISAVLPSDS